MGYIGDGDGMAISNIAKKLIFADNDRYSDNLIK